MMHQKPTTIADAARMLEQVEDYLNDEGLDHHRKQVTKARSELVERGLDEALDEAREE